MPNPLDFLRQLSQPKLPKRIGEPIPREQYDIEALKQQEQDPAWKKVGRQAIEGLVDLTQGALFGDPLDPSASKGNLIGQGLAAGVPLGTGIKGLYSRLGRAMETLPSARAIHPNKALSVAKNMASGEEVEYRKLGEFLKAKGNQPVKKEEILGHLEQNPMQVEVKELGPTEKFQGPEWHDDAEPTKYGGPTTTLPGGENYRETLTLDKQ